MKHRIGITEDKNGFYSIQLNGRIISYGLTKDKAFFLYRGIAWGIDEAGDEVILEDSIFEIFKD